MNRTAFWRVLWKEYRSQRAFWIAMLALVALVDLLGWLVAGEARPNRLLAFYHVALGLAAFYGLGSGATLFATEHETGTYDFQRSLPLSARRLFAAKMAFAGASTAALLALAWLVGFAFAGGSTVGRTEQGQLWGVWGFAAVELLVWGVFFSLRSHRPLVAVILAVSFASVTVHLLAGERLELFDPAVYVSVLPYRAAIVAVVLAADVWMGLRWLDEPGRAARRRAARHAAAGEAVISSTVPAPRATVLGRLVWQHFRQSWRLIAAFGVMLLPLVVLFGLGPRVGRTFDRMPLADVLVFFAGAGSFLAAPLMGACVFLADQSGYRFRFLAEHGVRPRYVWLSRHLVWLAVVVIGTALVLLALLPTMSRGGAPPDAFEALAYLCGFIFLAYACGQLCSMYIHSGILAAVGGLVLTGSLCAWAGLMHAMKLSWLWSVAPLPVAFLFATWLRSPDWLLERRSWRARVRAVLPVVLPMAAILVAVPFARIHQVPLVDPGFDPAAYARPATPEEQATTALYAEATEQMNKFFEKHKSDPKPAFLTKEEPPSPDRLTAQEERWLKENQEALRLTLEASQRKEADFFPAVPGERVPSLPTLATLVSMSAKQLEIEGKLDAALDRYLAVLRMSGQMRHRSEWPEPADRMEMFLYENLKRWSTRQGQAPERITGAIRQIREITGQFRSPCDGIKTRYIVALRLLHADPDALATLGDDKTTKDLLKLVDRWLPWEQARAIRMLNLATANGLEACRSAEQAAAEGGIVVPEFYRSWAQDYGSNQDIAEAILRVFISDTPQRTVWSIGQIEERRRTALLVLALEAWKLQHGALPEKLDAVVGPYLDKVPNDPYTGEPFRYFPKGLPIKLEWSEWPSPSKQTIEPGKPFLWSGGLRVIPSGQGGDPTTRYRIRDERGAWDPRATVSEYEVLRAGWIVPIPSS